MTVTKPQRRWLQFSLRSLLVFVTLFAIPCSWLAVHVQEAKREREAAAAIEKLGGSVSWSEPSEPVWLTSLLGDHLFQHAEEVDVTIYHRIVDDKDLVGISCFSRLRSLSLNATFATDAALANVKALSKLEALQLMGTRITDAGLENIKNLERLSFLDLTNDNITDAGLDKLTTLKQLQELQLLNTHVTSEGIKKLMQALPDCDISY